MLSVTEAKMTVTAIMMMSMRTVAVSISTSV